MNANELADALQETEPYYSTDYKLFDKSATMLRQQQAEIAELKHMNRNWQISENILLLELEKLQHCELTDEVILKLEEIEFDNYCVDKESKGRKTATITDPEWAIWFARAILRKAQEK